MDSRRQHLRPCDPRRPVERQPPVTVVLAIMAVIICMSAPSAELPADSKHSWVGAVGFVAWAIAVCAAFVAVVYVIVEK